LHLDPFPLQFLIFSFSFSLSLSLSFTQKVQELEKEIEDLKKQKEESEQADSDTIKETDALKAKIVLLEGSLSEANESLKSLQEESTHFNGILTCFLFFAICAVRFMIELKY